MTERRRVYGSRFKKKEEGRPKETKPIAVGVLFSRS
jgi:hypothetical protein